VSFRSGTMLKRAVNDQKYQHAEPSVASE